MRQPAFFKRRRRAQAPDALGRLEIARPKGTVHRHLMVSRRGTRLLVLTCLLLSVMLYNFAHRFEMLQVRFEFERLGVRMFNAVEARIQTDAMALEGAAIYLGTRKTANDAELTAYGNGLARTRGMQALPDLSFVSASAADDQAAHAPHGALLSARDSGRAVMALPAPAANDQIGPATYLMIQPVFAQREGAEEGMTGSNSFAGWVTATFSTDALFSALHVPDGALATLALYDGVAPAPDAIVFSSPGGQGELGRFVSDHVLNANGRSLLLRLVSTPAYDAEFLSPIPLLLMLAGLFVSLVFGLTLKSGVQRHSALKNVAEQRARQLEAREGENRALLETNVSVVFLLDSEGQIIFANEAAARLFKCARSDFLGHPFSMFIRSNAKNDICPICNARGLPADGRTLMLDVQSNTWLTAENVTQTTVLVRDVTEQIVTRMEIEAVRRRYDVALSGAGIGVFEIDMETGQAQMSETWHKIMGTEDVQGNFDNDRHFWSRIHPDDLPALLRATRRCLAGETSRSVAEFRIKSGTEWRWMYSYSVPFAQAEGGPPKRLIGTQSDITDLRHARNAVEASEAQFRTVLQEAPVGMAVLDELGAFIGVNAALARLGGYDEHTMRSKMRLGDLLSRKDYVRMSRDVRALLKAGLKKTYQNQFEVLTRSGEVRWGLFNLSWTFDKNRGENVYIAQIVDITDEKRLAQIKSEFVATVSHELRTPLTSIKGALGLLETTADASLSIGSKRLLEIARVNADRLIVIVNDILDLEKISSGEVSFHCTDLPLDELIAQTLGELQPFATGHSSTLFFEPSEAGLMVHVDAGRVRQVLANLVSNACKFSDPDTPVVLRYLKTEDGAQIFVENTGPPIPQHFHADLFKPFTQADGSDTRSTGGAGLGLNISHQIVNRLGGCMGFEQQPERKTVFWFTCPLAQDVLAPDTVEEFAPLVHREGPLRILHIEDDRDFADVIAAGFEGLVDLSHASSLAQARGMLDQEGWNVVLVDWGLPDGNALELLDQIANEQPEASIVSLSAASTAVNDPRVMLRLIKSQVDIQRIVEQVIALAHERERSAAKYSDARADKVQHG